MLYIHIFAILCSICRIFLLRMSGGCEKDELTRRNGTNGKVTQS